MLRPRSLIFAALVLTIGSAGWSFYKEALVGDAMGDAAKAFIGTLNDEQQRTVVLAYDVPQRVDWHFIPKDERKGLQIKHMSEPQRKARTRCCRRRSAKPGTTRRGRSCIWSRC